MRRTLHTFVALVAVLLIVRPLDCFGTGAMTQEAMECCLKGKCRPTATAGDDCCKGIVVDSTTLAAESGTKAADHRLPVLADAVPEFVSALPGASYVTILASAHSPPGSPPGTSVRLPLLI